ncbi:MAG: hypothetical protein IT331_24590 [Anaerolineae bacterium]|nr:hypothetical protein [Anaerolineae bacterium]
MLNVYLIPFVSLFRDQGAAETRSFSTRGFPGLPDDDYALFESYCPDPECDCRRVMLNVMGRHQGKEYLASISFGFDRAAELAGPFLDNLNPQSRYALSLLEAVEQILADPAYVARLESHYRMVKQAAADSSHPVQTVLKRWRSDAPSNVGSRQKRKKKQSRRR